MNRRFLFFWVALATLMIPHASFGQPTRIPFFIPSGATIEISRLYLNLIQRFHELHPDIIVDFKPTTNYNRVLKTVINRHQKGKICGVIVAEISELFTLKDAGVVVPLEPFIYKEKHQEVPFLTRFHKEFLGNSRDNEGRLYGLPFFRSTPTIYYNLDILKSAGYNRTNLPKTWLDLKQMLIQLKTITGKAPLGFGGTWYDWIFESFVRQNNGKLSAQQNTQVLFDHPSTIEALSYLQDLNRLGLIQRIHSWKATLNSFVHREQFPVMYYSVGGLETVRKKADFAWTISLMPIQKTHQTPLGGANIFMSSHMTQAEQIASWKLIKFLLEPDVQIEISYASGYFPVIKKTLQDPILLRRNQLFPPFSIAYRQLFYGRSKIMTKNFMEIRKILKEAIDATLDQNMDPASSLHLAQVKSQRWLK